MNIRDRIQELRRVPASTVAPNPHNTIAPKESAIRNIIKRKLWNHI